MLAVVTRLAQCFEVVPVVEQRGISTVGDAMVHQLGEPGAPLAEDVLTEEPAGHLRPPGGGVHLVEFWSPLAVVSRVFFLAMLFAEAVSVGDELDASDLATWTWRAVWHQDVGSGSERTRTLT